MTLSENEYKVLNVLLKNPSLSYTDIAQTLGLSVTSIRNLLFSLMEYEETSSFEDDEKTKLSSNTNYINKNNKTSNLHFFAMLKFELLNLTRFDFFITCSSENQLRNVSKFCDAHPYTSFRGRIHGGKNGVYIVFYMPNETLNMLLFSLELLKREKLIDDFEQIILSTNFLIFSLLKIDVFDVNEKKWNFNFEEFKANINKYSSNEARDFFEKDKNNSILQKIDKIDVMILSEWGYGAGPRKTKAELLNNISNGKIYENFVKDLKLNRYIISDHVDALLKHNIVKQVGIGFDRKKIQILATLFFIGKAKVEFLNTFANYIHSDDFPFDSTLSVGDLDSTNQTASYTWWVNFTANIVSKFTEFLFENSIVLKTFVVTYNALDMDNYPLYHANFIHGPPNNNHWNTSEENCLIEPLKVFLDSEKIKNLSTDFHKYQKDNKDKS